MRKMTEQNMRESLAGESQAYIKYMAFAARADKEGKPNVARLFRAAAFAGKTHATEQAQVLGLSRTLRRKGVEVRVLAPCDGPPPATFVTPLGNSLPTAANGSVAPLAPDPACALRTMRVMFEEQFDVLHLHEPFAPGPGELEAYADARARMAGDAPIFTRYYGEFRGLPVVNHCPGAPIARRLLAEGWQLCSG